MGYQSIDNLYKNQDILAFRRGFALEKVHGTSAHVAWSPPGGSNAELRFFSGGAKQLAFEAVFHKHELLEKARALNLTQQLTVFGEAYGGSQQGMKATYGPELRFIAFDVFLGAGHEGRWLAVPEAELLVKSLGLEFVPFNLIDFDLEAIDRERDAPSLVAVRRGVEGTRWREGVILRPPFEVTGPRGRVIAKHKRAEFSECATPQKVVDPAKLEVLKEANAIAEQWVTHMRLAHVLDKLKPIPSPGGGFTLQDTPFVIEAMVADVLREAAGEIVDSKDARASIGKRTAKLFKERVTQVKVAS